ncbi:MAG TPA: hypothetical protein VFL94_00940 [Actinomycetales bacterium]|nr:hypothetical protein [Actinomycetales bacterium]
MSTDDATADRPRLDVGQEASRLAEALQGWWAQTSSTPSSDSGSPFRTASPGADDHDPATCRMCPLCRALDVVRGISPELLEQVASAAETVAVLLREAAGDRQPGPSDAPPPAPGDEKAEEGQDGDDPLAVGTPVVVIDGEQGGERA